MYIHTKRSIKTEKAINSVPTGMITPEEHNARCLRMLAKKEYQDKLVTAHFNAIHAGVDSTKVIRCFDLQYIQHLYCLQVARNLTNKMDINVNSNIY